MLENILDKIYEDTNGNKVFISLINKDKEFGGHLEEFFNEFYVEFKDQYANDNAGNITDIYNIHGWEFDVTDIHEKKIYRWI